MYIWFLYVAFIVDFKNFTDTNNERLKASRNEKFVISYV